MPTRPNFALAATLPRDNPKVCAIRVKGRCPLRVQGGARKKAPAKANQRFAPLPLCGQTAIAATLSRTLTTNEQDNPSVMLRMTAPFTQRSLGKSGFAIRFSLHTGQPLSLAFLSKERGIPHNPAPLCKGGDCQRIYPFECSETRYKNNPYFALCRLPTDIRNPSARHISGKITCSTFPSGS